MSAHTALKGKLSVKGGNNGHVWRDERRIGRVRALRTEALACSVQSARCDPVMLHLALALLPALSRSNEANARQRGYT